MARPKFGELVWDRKPISINSMDLWTWENCCFVCLPWVRTGHVLTFTCAAVFATLHVHLWESVGSAGVALIPTQIQALSLPLKIFKTGDSLRNEIRGSSLYNPLLRPTRRRAAALFIASHWRKSLSRLKWDLGINYRGLGIEIRNTFYGSHTVLSGFNSSLWNFQIYFQCMYFLFWMEGQGWSEFQH